MLLFVLSCENTLTDSDGTGDNLTFYNIAGKLLVLSDSSYVANPYSEDGKSYRDTYGGTYTFVEEISKTKRIYQKQYQNFYYGHEIKSDSLYVTDGIAYGISEINWEKTAKVGGFVSNYSAEFLNNVKGKKLSGCENYFDPCTGGTYISKGNASDDKFNFVQALSPTKAIYKNEKQLSFLGLTIVNGDLYATDEKATSINTVDWDTSTNVGTLY